MSRSSRRHFAKSLAVAAAAMPLAGTEALAQTPPPPAESPLATALAVVVRAQHGKHLSEDEMKRIEKDFQDYIPYLDRFRDFKLVNSDEPDYTFSSLTRR